MQLFGVPELISLLLRYKKNPSFKKDFYLNCSYLDADPCFVPFKCYRILIPVFNFSYALFRKKKTQKINSNCTVFFLTSLYLGGPNKRNADFSLFFCVWEPETNLSHVSAIIASENRFLPFGNLADQTRTNISDHVYLFVFIPLYKIFFLFFYYLPDVLRGGVTTMDSSVSTSSSSVMSSSMSPFPSSGLSLWVLVDALVLVWR